MTLDATLSKREHIALLLLPMVYESSNYENTPAGSPTEEDIADEMMAEAFVLADAFLRNNNS